MNTYTTCADCGHIMHIADPAMLTHPNCAEPADPIGDLAALWLAAAERDDRAEADRLAAILDRPQPAPRMVDAALAYAAWGWAVFPLRPGLKVPLTKHGFKEASADPDCIRSWWQATPAANIGLPTGDAFDVIDVDAPKGWRSLWQMQDADAIPPVHGVVSTAGSGLHYYVRPTGKGNAAGLLPGIDYRGTGGYVVAPPSVDSRGRRYQWRHKPSPNIITADARAA